MHLPAGIFLPDGLSTEPPSRSAFIFVCLHFVVTGIRH